MRVQIQFTKPFQFSTTIPVLINHINFGGHVGNDSTLSILHEARIRFLKQWNFTEMDCGGVSLIMADSMVQYKAEGFLHDVFVVEIYAEKTSSKSFDLYYKISTQREHKTITIANAKTGMVCFDYKTRKIAEITDVLDKML